MWFFNQIQNKDIQFIKFLRSLCLFLQNDTIFNRFYVRIKKNSESEFKISIFKFLYCATRSVAFYFREIRNQLRYADILP